jgi:SAM-dependent methyltransferase
VDAASIRPTVARGEARCGSASDLVNRRTWESPSSLRLYRKLEGFIEAGERNAFALVRSDARLGKVLDIGVGGGRTAGLLLAETQDYVGIDYTPAMVAACRMRFPGKRFEIADARDLGDFATGEFQLVVFSYNGLDSVDEEDRKRVLDEVARVLVPGGAFFFSTFNRLGPGFERNCLTMREIDLAHGLRTTISSLAKYVVGTAIGQWHKWTVRGLEKNERGGKLRLHPAHDYGILVHTSTLVEVHEELAVAGFSGNVEAFGRSGRRLDRREEARDEEYFHLVARKL